MKVFIIERLDHYSWCENYKAVVVEKDALCAERKARCEISGFEKPRLKVTEINLEEVSILSIENTGA